MMRLLGGLAPKQIPERGFSQDQIRRELPWILGCPTIRKVSATAGMLWAIWS